MSSGRPAGVMIQVTDLASAHEQIVTMNEALILGAVRQNELAEEADRARAEAEAATRGVSESVAKQVLKHLRDQPGIGKHREGGGISLTTSIVPLDDTERRSSRRRCTSGQSSNVRRSGRKELPGADDCM